MQDWQKRVVKEREDLSEKITKLETYSQTGAFFSLTFEDQSLLEKQHRIMKEYENILGQRIRRFNNHSPLP